MGKLINIKGRYDNADVVGNVIRYITRTRANETRFNELRGYGGAGVGNYDSPEVMEQRFNTIQKLYGINYRKGRRIFHEVFSITDSEFENIGSDMGIVNQVALEMCREYFNEGFQVVYAVHREEIKKLHIHFAVNAVSFITGKKFDTSVEGNRHREQKFNEIMKRYYELEEFDFDGMADME
ncbi:MAG: relaxase/mobilization nuclease domain-containing protein [Lachnospiraceae bacterium]|nr:relaxase/mobilization nuclease domain-containing protein [Lachnospiraceae bacterium]